MSVDAVERLPPLVLNEGGPGDAVLRRLRLAPIAEHARRAALVLAAVTWLPLLVLSALQGLAVAGASIPFLSDVGAHVRFLVAVPILVLAEIPIGTRLRQVAADFIETGLVRQVDEPRFAAIILETRRFRDSRAAELLVLAAAYVSAYTVLASALQRGSTWSTPDPSGRMTAAGSYALDSRHTTYGDFAVTRASCCPRPKSSRSRST